MFEKKTTLRVEMQEGSQVGALISVLRDQHLHGSQELFVDGETVRAGILVLINDVDWELEGLDKYVIKNGDEVTFISTLHGG